MWKLLPLALVFVCFRAILKRESLERERERESFREREKDDVWENQRKVINFIGRFHSKLLKDDSLSYESTLAKLKLGSQRKLTLISDEVGVVIEDASVSSSTNSEPTKVDSNCSSASTSRTQDGPGFASSHNGDAMSIDPACRSPTKQPSPKECERDEKLVSIAYLFSKFKNPHHHHHRRVVGSASGVDSVSMSDNVCSAGGSLDGTERAIGTRF